MASMMKTFNELRESITMQKFHGRLETIKENETFILTFEILIAENCQNFHMISAEDIIASYYDRLESEKMSP